MGKYSRYDTVNAYDCRPPNTMYFLRLKLAEIPNVCIVKRIPQKPSKTLTILHRNLAAIYVLKGCQKTSVTKCVHKRKS
jgi:hypothetical protein